MSKKYVNEAVFDTMLAKAFMEEFEQEMDELEKEPLERKELPGKYRKLERKYYNKLYGNKTKKHPYLCRIAACVLICMSIGFACLMATPNVRATVWESMVTFYEKYLKIDFGADKGEQIGDFYAGYIPDGFVRTEEFETEFQNMYQYENEAQMFLIMYYKESNNNIDYDQERGTLMPVRINGQEAYCIEYNNETIAIVWELDNCSFVIEGNISLKEMLDIAEKIS